MEEKEIVIRPEAILEQLYAIATCNVAGAVEAKDGNLEIRDTRLLTKAQQFAIAAMEKTTGGIKIKFYDKLKALELLGKFLGLFEPAQQPKTENSDLLEEVLQATRKELDYDIPELQQAADDCYDLVESPGP